MAHPLRFDRLARALVAIIAPLVVLTGLYRLTPPIAISAATPESAVFDRFYDRETAEGVIFRWSSPASRIVLPQIGRPAAASAILGIWNPLERPPFPVAIEAGGQPLVVLQPQTGRRSLHLLVPRAALGGGDLQLALRTTLWHPPQETRDLGLAISSVAWQPIADTLPPWLQLAWIGGLTIALGTLLLRLRACAAHAWPIAGAAGAGLAAGAALLPLRVAPFTGWILLGVLIGHGLLILRTALPRVLPRTLAPLAALHFAGYAALWAILHVSRAAPAFDNGYFTPDSRYVAVVEALPVVRWLLDRPTITRLCFLLIIVALSALYFWTLRCVRDQPMPKLAPVIALTIGAALPLLFLPRLLSLDVYSYALYGRMAVVYGQNPFITQPDQFPQDPLIRYIAWTTTPSVYGPAMVDVSLPLTWLAQALGGSPGIYVLVYKIAAAAAFVGSIVVLKALLDAVYPARSLWGVIAFAWHPLVLIELVGSGHNDSLMILLILVALLLAVRRRPLLTVLVLTVAGMVKLVALALIPLYAMYLLYTARDRRIWLLARQVAVALGVIVALYAPYWVGPRTLEVLSTAPPLRVLRGGLPAWAWLKAGDRVCVTPPPDQPLAEPQYSDACLEQLRDQIRNASLALFLVIYAALVLWPIRSFDALLDRSGWALVAYTMLAAINFRSWYLTWIVVLVPLMRRPRMLLLVWACTIFLDYSRLPIWERNLLGFVPILVLFGSMAIESIRQLTKRRAGEPRSFDDRISVPKR